LLNSFSLIRETARTLHGEASATGSCQKIPDWMERSSMRRLAARFFGASNNCHLNGKNGEAASSIIP
jgi:hypothetical protein